MRAVSRIVWHHSAGGTLGPAVATMESKGLHYHRLIDKDGSVYKMRDYDLMAYHAGVGGNTASIGICFIGNFYNTGITPTKAQYDSALKLTQEIESIYGTVNHQNHYDVGATACPGIDIAKKMRELVTTADKSRDTESEPTLTDEAKKTFVDAIALGIWKVPIENCTLSDLPTVQGLMELYNMLVFAARNPTPRPIKKEAAK